MVVFINLNWHYFRVWLPKMLQETRGYTLDESMNVLTVYYIAADIGVILVGVVASWLARRGWSVYGSRMVVLGVCCLLATASTVVAILPRGPLLLVMLFLVGFGSLGCFSIYYSLTQDLSNEHQGKISGSLSTCTWLVTATAHPIVGYIIDKTKNYDPLTAGMGWLPMLSMIAVLLLWNVGSKSKRQNQTNELSPDKPVVMTLPADDTNPYRAPK